MCIITNFHSSIIPLALVIDYNCPTATRTLQFFLVQMMILPCSLTRLTRLTGTTALTSQVKPGYAAFLHLILFLLNCITGLSVSDTRDENRPTLLADRSLSIEHHYIFRSVVYHLVRRHRGPCRR